MERRDWLGETGQQDRRELAGDCIARALNEAQGGGNYGDIWQEVTESTQRRFPEKDADSGVEQQDFQDIYQAHGMSLVLNVREDIDNVMRGHLDVREIPSLIGKLFQERGEPLVYIACSEGHAVAVVDGCLMDSWDSRDMADRTRYRRDGTLVELWLRTQEATLLEEVREVIRKYETVRQYDDVLTQGRRRRNAMADQG